MNFDKIKLMMVVFAMFAGTAIFAQDIKVQQGVATIAAGATTVTLSAPANFTAVTSLNKAFVRITNSQNTGAGSTANQTAREVCAYIQFTAVNTIVIRRNRNTNATRVCWEIVEYVGSAGGANEFIVRTQGLSTFANRGATKTETVTGAVTLAKLAGFVTGVLDPWNSAANYYSNLVTASIPNLTTIQFDRMAPTANDAIIVSYAVVEFTGSNWTVQRVQHQYTAAGAVETETLGTAVGLNNAFVHVQKRNMSTALTGVDEYGHQVWISATNQVSFQLRAGANTPASQYSVAWVISNPNMNVQRGNGTLTSTGTSPYTGSLTFTPAVDALSNTSLFWNNDCSGTGTTFPQPMLAVRLTATNTIEYWRANGTNGVANSYRYEVVKWPLPPFQISGTVYTDEGKTTPIGAGKKISISVNGGVPVTALTNASGLFTAYVTVAAGNVITAYIDAETEKGSIVTITDGVTAYTGANQLQLVTNKIILEYRTGTSITNTNLAVISGIDPEDDDGITVTAGNATFATGRELWISSAKNYAPGGNVTAPGGILISGIFTPVANIVTVGRNWRNSGTFTAGTSTVVFNDAATTSTITGSSTFYNITCSTASKNIVVTQGTTQTVGGLLTINGAAFTTRVSLASSGGFGTTWNLVLNGTYDCGYVAVQGSTASGTVYLPINPVGFMDNGNNTNWYDPNLPAEMVFYDNFETSTLAAAPPNKPSSYWTITNATWFTQAATTVNTQNHTSGGTKSMYSSGGTSGQGIGCWNNPGWGPVTNGAASAWFYDDMQAPKYQWIAADNSTGSQWIGVIINTATSATKYCYYSSSGAPTATPTFIDRSLGWHEVKWMRTASGTTYISLDGAQLFSTTGISDFSDFDCGTWNWYPTNPMPGSTACWFDDFMVYRSQNQSRYRWYENDSAQTPTAIVAENTAITARNIGTVTRLRLQVQNNQFETWAGAYVALQFRKGANGSWESLSSSADWNYANGLGTDKAQVANALLTNTNVREQFVESIPSAANIAMTTSQYGEWDFCVNSTGTATLATIYYFRLVVTDSAGIYQRSLAAYDFYPQCTLVSPTMTQWNGGTDTNWNTAANWSNGIPDATKDAIILTTAARDCSLNVSGAACKSLVVQSGRILTLGTAATSLTVTQDITAYGTIIHSNNTAVLNMSGGILRIDTTGIYNHSGNAAFNASTATIQVINGGQYNVSGAPVIAAQTLNIAVGGLVNITGPATFTLQNFITELNSQWTSTNTGNTVNISNNFINNGSMLGSTGGIFNLTKASGTMDGASTTTIFYQLNVNGGITSNITNDVRVLNNFSVASGKSFGASSGNLYVGGNWTNTGTFTHGSGTVILNGAALQTVTAGGSNFNHLTVTNASVAGVSFSDAFSTAYFTNITANSLMTFAANRTYNITATSGMNFQGTAGQLVKLRSGTSGSIWFINPSGGGWTANYLDVKDSVNIVEQAIFPTNSTDSGNNTNWFTAGQDTNGDEIPDWWEYLYYGSLTGLNAGTDSDGDGVNNLLEYVIGSIPTNSASPTVVYVDDNGGYDGVGTVGNPYKYLDDALDAAVDGQMVKLAEGTYQISNYSLSERLLIKGTSARKSIIKGPAALGTSGTDGQMLDFTGTRFAMSDMTVRLYKDDQPVITYNNNGSGIQVYQNMIFKDNNVSARAIISPNGAQTSMKVLIANNLFYNNTAGSAIELKANPCNAINNTIVNNTAIGLLYSGAGNSNITNNIVFGNTLQISNTGSGTLAVTYSDVQGGYTGTGNITGTPLYMNSANGIFRLLITSPGYNYGTTTYDVYDQDSTTRVTPVLGAYTTPALDYDNDGRTNAQETSAGTNLNNPDSDNDGLYDGEEVTYGTNPLNTDTDGDLVIDGQESPIGMNPAVFDGQILVGIYYESFENQLQYPVSPVSVGGTGPWSGTIWGANTKYYGNIQVQYVGPPPAAYDLNKIINFKGQIFPRSYNISFIERNSLPQWWISTAFVFPRKPLPTDYNEACCIGGAFFRVNENGNFCVYDASIENWRVSSTVIPDATWANITVGRNHVAKTCNLWVGSTQVFSNIPISGPDPNEFIRISISSASEYDVKVDLMIGYSISPF